MIVLNGEEIEFPQSETAETFSKHKRPRGSTALVGCVLHHTAGEGVPSRVRKTLDRRGLSTHFTVGYDGQIQQDVDPIVDIAFTAGRANNFTWSIEVVSKGLPPALGSRPRDKYKDRLRGRNITFLDWTAAQYDSVESLIRCVHGYLGIGFVWPLAPDGAILRCAIDLEHLQGTVGGIWGHYHIEGTHKIDPGPRPLETLMQRMQ